MNLPGHTATGAVLFAIVEQLVTSNVLRCGFAVVEEVLLVLHCAVGALVPLLVAGVALLVCGTGLLGGSPVIGILSQSLDWVLRESKWG